MAGFTKEYEKEQAGKQLLAQAIRVVGRGLLKRIDNGEITSLEQVRKMCYAVSKGINNSH